VITVKSPYEIGFAVPSPENSFWFITKFGLELYDIDFTGEIKKVIDAPNAMYMSFAFKYPRFFAPIGVMQSKKETRIVTCDSDYFDPDYEGLEELLDYCPGDELWPCKGPDEDHQEDPDWAIAWTLDVKNNPEIDASAVMRAACSWPLLAWRRNLKVSVQCPDPFSAVAPPGVISTISKSKGIVFSNLSFGS